MPPQFVVIGNPLNRRVTFFQEALARRGLPAALVLDYASLIESGRPLDEAVPPGSFVRIDSPGEDFCVEKLLLAEGADEAEAEGSPFLSKRDVARLELDRGLILFPRQWYLGYRRLLRRWQDELYRLPDVLLLSRPDDIVVMFDKVQCHARCEQAGVPVPRSLGAVCADSRGSLRDPTSLSCEAAPSCRSALDRGAIHDYGANHRSPIRCYDDLIRQADLLDVHRAFVKLAHGSSASGVVAWRRQGTRQVAITSAELVRNERGEPRLYNSLRIRRYTDDRDIRTIIDALAREQVHVEEWLPKASVSPGTNFDLRIVSIGGEPQHTVVRQSRSPMTNLHLGNARGDFQKVLKRLGPERWIDIQSTCRQSAALFPRSLMVGIDLAISSGFTRHAVLELNAFGDLLPGILYEGLDTYSAQVEAVMSRSADRNSSRGH